MKKHPKFDPTIVICILLLAGISLAILASIAPQFLLPQIFFYLLGGAVFIIFSRLDYRIFANFSWPLYILCLALLFITLMIGLETRGAVRWITIGSFRLQFSEILKPFFITSLAGLFISRSQSRSFKDFFSMLILVALPIFLVFKQPDLGSALVYAFFLVTMLFVSGADLAYFFVLAVAFLIISPLGWHFLADYQKNRIVSFLFPASDPLGASYNAVQALITTGSGMIFGRGLGRGTQSHLFFLPERHTDFIFASLAEELGFVGAGAVLLIYFVLVWKILLLSQKTPSLYAKIITAGIAMLIFSQVFISVGMNLGILPVAGITLPLVSYGGSSVFSTLILLGIAQNVSQTLRESDEAIHIV